MTAASSVTQVRDELGGVVSYRPSGRVAWTHFLPLAGTGLLASGIMAWVMYSIEARAYMMFLTPALLSLPLFATLFLAIYMGRCRNIMLAGALAALMFTIFYFGFWLLSYYFNVVMRGPLFQQRIEEYVGVRGLAGYFIFRCRVDGLRTSFDRANGLMILNMLFRSLEFSLLLASALFLARRLAKRVYFEDYARWASSCTFGFVPADMPTVLQAVQGKDWALLKNIEKCTVSRDQRLRGNRVFRAEYLPGSVDQPVYVTVEGAVMPGVIVSLMPFFVRLTQRWISQQTVPAESAHELKKYFGGLDLGDAPRVDDQPAQPADAANIGYWRGDQSVQTKPHSGAIHSMLTEMGYAGRTLVGTSSDFRNEAAAASLQKLTDGWSVDSIYSSLCYPAENDPLPRLKLISRITVIIAFCFLGSVFASIVCMFGSPMVMSFGAGYVQIVRLIGMGMLCLALFFILVLMFIFAPIARWTLESYLSRRGDSMIGGSRLPRMLIRIEDPATFHISKVTPEDWGLCVMDAKGRRLLIEGLSHHYLIRGCDVMSIKPTTSSSSVSVQINFRIGDFPFAVVMDRYGMGGAVVAGFASQPIIGWVIRLIVGSPSARFARRLCHVLELPPPLNP